MARSTHKVTVPISAAERRLILETARLDDEIAERLDEIDPREEVVSLTIAELVRLAIATAGNPTKLSNETDRNMWVRLSDRFHEVVGGILRSDRP
jgi:thiamine biosynthesis lipoprotein ApbE